MANLTVYIGLFIILNLIFIDGKRHTNPTVKIQIKNANIIA